MGTSFGQGRIEEVIMASSVCPFWLNAWLLIAKAGRFFCPVRSENGNGTATTSQASQVMKRFFVFGRVPLGQRIFQSGVEGAIEGFDATNQYHIILDLILYQVSWIRMDL